VPVHAWPQVLEVVKRIFAYAFEENTTGSFKPRFDLREVDVGAETFAVAGVEVQQIPIDHGDCRVLGVRIGDLAYLPDVKAIPDVSAERLQHLDTLLIGAPVVRDHPTHWRLEQALEQIAELAPRQAFLTHLSHNLDADTADDELPEGVGLAYDGLCLPIQ
jgi:phosphoribosyl 1,2-cyclic phosphate phosphodiesterase